MAASVAGKDRSTAARVAARAHGAARVLRGALHAGEAEQPEPVALLLRLADVLDDVLVERAHVEHRGEAHVGAPGGEQVGVDAGVVVRGD